MTSLTIYNIVLFSTYMLGIIIIVYSQQFCFTHNPHGCPISLLIVFFFFITQAHHLLLFLQESFSSSFLKDNCTDYRILSCQSFLSPFIRGVILLSYWFPWLLLKLAVKLQFASFLIWLLFLLKWFLSLYAAISLYIWEFLFIYPWV